MINSSSNNNNNKISNQTSVSTNDRDIKTISFAEACRTKRGMYLSADDEEAIHLGIREIICNSLDAFSELNLKQGTVKIIIDTKNRKVTVQDNGPGIPIKQRPDGTNSVAAALSMQHTGSHFDNRKVSSIGTNGVGASIVTHTADWVEAINNDGKTAIRVTFKGTDKGAILDKIEEVKFNKDEHGLTYIYEPDYNVYHDAWFNEQTLISMLDEMMPFYPKYQAQLTFDGHTTLILYPKGLKENNTCMYYESENVIISLSQNMSGEGHIKAFGNRLQLQDGGQFFTQFKTTMTKTINAISGLKLKGEQIQKLFDGSVAIFVSNPLFSNQAKTKIANTECNLEVGEATQSCIEKFAKTKEWDKMVKLLEAEQKADEAAERARKKIQDAMNGIKKGSKNKGIVAEKLKDCINHGEDTYLAIGEGDSAVGALVQGRDQQNVALFPIRGKFINCLKNAQEEFLTNEELQQVCSILGCGIFKEYNPKKLKYGKVLIAVDADQDGLNIACLLMTFFYVCMPEFIKEGRLYWMRAPLYIKDNEYIFTEEQWKKVKNKAGFKRCKG